MQSGEGAMNSANKIDEGAIKRVKRLIWVVVGLAILVYAAIAIVKFISIMPQ